jgi:predicted DNA-binding protein (MmcQ/YjbR family)
MAKASNALERMREICLSLPDTKETPTWGSPHFRVGEKIFAGCGEHQGKGSIGFKLEMLHAAAIVERPGFTRAPYVGHKGWVSLDVDNVEDWDEVRALVHESYRLIAPKKSLAKLSPPTKTPHPPASERPTKKAAVKKPPRKRTAAKKPPRKKTAAKKPPIATKAPRKKAAAGRTAGKKVRRSR